MCFFINSLAVKSVGKISGILKIVSLFKFSSVISINWEALFVFGGVLVSVNVYFVFTIYGSS